MKQTKLHTPSAPKKQATRGVNREQAHLEKEAKTAATQIEARRPVGALSAAAPAPLPAGGVGPGQPLPAATRIRLEEGFGADLAALRIHAGTQAASAAGVMNARAFAAGPHLVFSKDAYQPHDADGLRLIAHETAHALQQGTGPAQRSATPQRAPGDGGDAADDIPEVDLTQLPSLWVKIRDYYLESSLISKKSPKPEFADDIAFMESLMGTGTLTPRVPTALSSKFVTAVSGVELKSFTGRCIAFDVMQLTGEDVAATSHLLANPALENITIHPKFLEYLRTQVTGEMLAEYYIDSPKTSPLAHRQFTAFQDNIKNFMMDPLAPLPAKGPLETYHAEQHALLNSAILAFPKGGKGPKTLNINPLQFMFIGLLTNIEITLFNRFRDEKYRKYLTETWYFPEEATFENAPYFEYLHRLAMLDTILNTPIGDTFPMEEPLRQRISEAIGGSIVAYLRQAEHAMRAAQGLLIAAHANAPAYPKHIGIKGVFVPELSAALTGLSDSVKHSNADSVLALASLSDLAVKPLIKKKPKAIDRQDVFHARIPQKGTLELRRDLLADKLAEMGTALHTAFLTQSIPSSPRDFKHLTSGGTLLAAMIWADVMEDWLRSLRINETLGSRADFRHTVAVAMRASALVFGHNGLRTATFRETHGWDARVSYAVILNPYERRGKNYRDIADDVGTDKIIFAKERTVNSKAVEHGAEPDTRTEKFAISPRDLVRLYNIQEMRAILAPLGKAITQRESLAKIRTMMTIEEEKAYLEDLKQNSKLDLINPEKDGEDAIKTIDEQLVAIRNGLSVPIYYESKESYIVVNSGDENSNLQGIQARHPSVAGFWKIARAQSPSSTMGGENYAFRDSDENERVYFWFVPSLEPIWLEFQKVEAIRELIADWRKNTSIAADAGPDAQLIQFYDWAEKKGKTDLIATKYGGHLTKETKDANAALLLEYRRMTGVNRLIVKDNMIDGMELYKGSVRAYNLPSLFGRHIAGFSSLVLPRSERGVQIALLMLQTSKQLKDMLDRVKSYDAVNFLLAPVSVALSIISGEEMTQTQEAELSPDMAEARREGIEATFKKLDPSYTPEMLKDDQARLVEIMAHLLTIRFKYQDNLKLIGGQGGGLFVTTSDVRINTDGANSAFIQSLRTGRDVTDMSEGVWHWPHGAAETDHKDPPLAGLLNSTTPHFYQIEEVTEPFQYVPSYASKTDASQKKGKAYTVQGSREIKPDQVLMIVRLAKIVKSGDGKNATYQNERIVEIRAKDVQLLDLMTAALEVQSRAVENAEFAESVYAGIGFVLDLLEFVPVVGPVITGVRLAKAIIDILRTLDWDELREDFIDAPTDLIKLIKTDFIGNLNSDMLWWFLLSPLTGEGNALKLLNAHATLKSKSNETRSKTRKIRLKSRNKGKLVRRFLGAVETVGPTFVDAFSNLLTRSTVGIDTALARVSRTPFLVGHLVRVDQYAQWLALGLQAEDALTNMSPEMAQILGGPGGLAVEGVMNNVLSGDGASALGDSIFNMLQPVSELELPDELLPMDLLVRMIIEMSLGSIHNKKFEAVYFLMDRAGVIDDIADFVAAHLVPKSFDPNIIWREEIINVIQTPFRKGRDSFVDEIGKAVGNVFSFEKGASFDIGTLPPIEVKTTKEAPKFEPFMRAGDPRHPHPGLLPRDIGRPLDKPMRDALQLGFGHDLSHVRLHDDPAAHAYVAASGAEALASGSHIYLGENTDPDSTQGDHILRHEVSHVLQHSGPRPLNAPGSDDPRAHMGEPGRGVTRHAGREAQADQMAFASRRRDADDDGPLPVRGAGPVSLAPFGQDDMMKVLTDMGEQARGADRSYIDRVTDGISGPSNKLTTRGRIITKQAGVLLDEIQHEVMKGPVKWKFGLKDPDSALKKLIQSAAKKGLKDLEVGDTYKAIAARLATLKPKRNRRPGNEYVLNFQSFLNVVSGYIYDSSGVRVVFDKAKDAHKPTGNVNISILGVHLGRIDYDNNRNLYLALKKDNEKGKSGIDFTKARAYYAARFPLPHDLNVVGGRLVLSTQEREAIRTSSKKSSLEAISTSSKKSSLKEMKLGNDLISWDSYKDPKANGLGVKVGTHGQLTAKSATNPTGISKKNVPNHAGKSVPDPRTIDNTERDSHHVPQFLLAEFYAGVSKKSAISIYGANGDFWTPGLTGGTAVSGDKTRKTGPFTGFKSATNSINFSPLTVESGRGSGMPAVSLWRETHQKGGLHLNRSTEWNSIDNDTTATPIQSATMVNMHRRAIIDAMKGRDTKLGVGKTGAPPADFDSREGFRKIVNYATKTGATTAQTEAAKDATFEAMQTSYTRFVQHMLPPLKTALSTMEKPYYARVAAATPGTLNDEDPQKLKKAYTPTKGDDWQGPIVAHLKDYNKRIYGAWFHNDGWS